MYLFCYYLLLFFIYSFFGWIIESIACSIIEHRLVLNRGFLIGPYIPIYGTASLIMIFFLSEYQNDPFVLFWMAVIYASILEYGTSYLMEKLFSARWWNYEHEKWNLNGRICLKNSLLFGVLGFFLINYVNPFMEYWIIKIPHKILIFISWTWLVIFLGDILITLWVLSKLKIRAKKHQGDVTKEIDQEIKAFLKNYKFFYKRLFRAFPKVHFTTIKGDAFLNRIRNRFDEADQFVLVKKNEIAGVKAKIKDLKQQAVEKDIIRKQKERLKEIRRKKFQ